MRILTHYLILNLFIKWGLIVLCLITSLRIKDVKDTSYGLEIQIKQKYDETSVQLYEKNVYPLFLPHIKLDTNNS